MLLIAAAGAVAEAVDGAASAGRTQAGPTEPIGIGWAARLDPAARIAWAAPNELAQPQPASRTATPRISLPTSSPDPRASATPTLERSVATPSDGRATVTPGASAPPPGGAATATSASGSGTGGDGDEDDDAGAADGSGTGGADRGRDAGSDGGGDRSDAGEGAAGRSGASDGGAAPGPGSEGASSSVDGGAPDDASGGLGAGSDIRRGLPALPWSDAAPATGLDPSAPGPRGIVAAPVSDPGIRRLWADSGSPRQGQGWGERLGEGRPGPWGSPLFYPLLALLLAWACRRAWLALDAAAGEG